MVAVMRGSVWRRALWPLLVAVLCVVNPSRAVEVYTPGELTVENGTQARLSCTFKTTQVVYSGTGILWRFKEEGSSSEPKTFFMHMEGKTYPYDSRFTDRVKWDGDLNKKDASIKIDKVTFKDNGTYTCEIMNPRETGGTKELKLRVVEKGNLPTSNVPFLVGIICAAIGGILLIAIIVFAIVITKKKRSRKNYTGCSTTESLMSPVKQPPRKSPSDTEALVTNAPTGTVQGPVIYAQLDHSGKENNQVNKSERVVYADIRKVC
ncbi:myelin protein zero-like protein 1 [Mantella aurantiaca]